MKLINKYKSPNYNKRNNSKIKFVIIHYTAINNYHEAITYLCDKKNKVSSHFLINQKGEIFSLVNEKYRAWHAGISYWCNYHDLNSVSLGIELDYSLSKKNNKFSNKMMKSICDLLKYLKNKYNISTNNVLGHSDIAPFRKKDPGKKFPWDLLVKNNVAYSVKKHNSNIVTQALNWFRYRNIKTNNQIALFILCYIGYDISYANNKKRIKKLIKVYQTHFMQKKINGNIDKNTTHILINHFLDLVLTKN